MDEMIAKNKDITFDHLDLFESNSNLSILDKQEVQDTDCFLSSRLTLSISIIDQSITSEQIKNMS